MFLEGEVEDAEFLAGEVGAAGQNAVAGAHVHNFKALAVRGEDLEVFDLFLAA